MKFGVCESTAVFHSVLFCLFLRSNLLHVKVPNIDFFFFPLIFGVFLLFLEANNLILLQVGIENWMGADLVWA